MSSDFKLKTTIFSVKRSFEKLEFKQISHVFQQEELPKERTMMELSSTSPPRGHADSAKSDASSISEHTKFVVYFPGF